MIGAGTFLVSTQQWARTREQGAMKLTRKKKKTLIRDVRSRLWTLAEGHQKGLLLASRPVCNGYVDRDVLCLRGCLLRPVRQGRQPAIRFGHCLPHAVSHVPVVVRPDNVHASVIRASLVSVHQRRTSGNDSLRQGQAPHQHAPRNDGQ